MTDPSHAQECEPQKRCPKILYCQALRFSMTADGVSRRNMSVVKMVKNTKALLIALEQTPKDKLRWWDHKQRILEQWLDTNGDDLGVEGASALIREQLQRGYEHEHLRIKCWKHIVIELSALVDDDNLQSNGTSSATASRRTSGNTQRVSEDLSLREREHGSMDMSELSFVERQEEWLRRKQSALRAKTHDLERAAKDVATFSPNLAISQSSLRPAQVSAVEVKLEQLAAEAERHARKNTFSTSIQEAKRRAEKDATPSSGNSSGPRRRSRMRRKGSTGDESSRSPRRGTAPAVSSQSDRREIGHLNPPADGDSDDGLPEYGGGGTSCGEDPPQALAEGGGGGEEEGVGASSEGEKGQDYGQEPEKPEEPPFETGSFFSKVDDKSKGHYKVRDVSRFMLTSMYKRKDRVTRTSGISLLVGKLEEPPHEEKVISALFDTDRFTEREAAQWWDQNGHRFEDARSLAEKEMEEGRRRAQERDLEAVRRASAPARAETEAKNAVISPSNQEHPRSPMPPITAGAEEVGE